MLVPDDYVGAVMSDLSSRRGRVLGTEPVGVGRTLVKAEIPELEITRYAIDLRSVSHGTGSFTRSICATSHSRRTWPPRWPPSPAGLADPFGVVVAACTQEWVRCHNHAFTWRGRPGARDGQAGGRGGWD